MFSAALYHDMSSEMENQTTEGNAPEIQPLMNVDLVPNQINVLKESSSEIPLN